MLDRAGVKSGQAILIHGAGGAVGSAATQIAHRRGVNVIATASARSLARVKANGAAKVIDYAAEPFENVVSNVDAVLDTVGGPVQQRSYSVIKPGGALVAITQPPTPEEAEKHNVNASFLITEVSTASLQTVAELIDSGQIKPLVARVLPLAEVAKGWREVHSNPAEGKVVFAVAA